jgi:hypothetical protein
MIGDAQGARLRNRCLWYLGLRFVLANNELLTVRLEDLQSDLYFSAAYRRVIEPLQLVGYREFHRCGEPMIACEFQFSSGYLEMHPALSFAGLKDLRWRFCMPKAARPGHGENENSDGSYRRERTRLLARSWAEIAWLDEQRRIDWREVVTSLRHGARMHPNPTQGTT